MPLDNILSISKDDEYVTVLLKSVEGYTFADLCEAIDRAAHIDGAEEIAS